MKYVHFNFFSLILILELQIWRLRTDFDRPYHKYEKYSQSLLSNFKSIAFAVAKFSGIVCPGIVRIP